MSNFLSDKKFKYTVLILTVASLLILVREVILRPKPLVIPEISLILPPVSFDLKLLKSQEIRDLVPFEKILVPEKFGRENPFEPY